MMNFKVKFINEKRKRNRKIQQTKPGVLFFDKSNEIDKTLEAQYTHTFYKGISFD